MNYFSEDTQNINAECENCGRVLKIPRDRCVAVSNGWTISPPISCQCGITFDNITSGKVNSNATYELTKLEAEKESLERRILQPGMSAAMAFVWIVVTILLSGVFSFMFGSNSPCGVFTMIGGLGALVIYFIYVPRNKIEMENRLKVVKSSIAGINMRLGKKGVGNNQQNAVNKIPETAIPNTQVSTTQNLDTELRRIKKLLDDGLITDEEYQILRKKLVGSA